MHRPAKTRARRLATATACALLIGLVVASAASATIRLGVYSAAPRKPTAMADPRVLDSFIAMTGRTPDILHDYGNVTEPLFSETELQNIEAHGVVPMMTWQLFKSGWSGSTITLPDIAAGRYDAELRAAAQEARGIGSEILIRFAHEMNGDWYPWRPGGESGNTGTNYVDAWRHVVSIFRAEGADNVKWVWCPNVDYGDYPFAQYFPGDEWIDYAALDGYNWGTGGQGYNKWQSLRAVFTPSYEKLTQLSSKPVMIAETSSSESGGDKAAWIRQGFLRTIPERFPRVKAVVWFDRDMEQDWRVNSSQSSLEAYREIASSTIYGGDVEVPLPPIEAEDEAGSGRKGKSKGKTVRSLRVTRRVTTGAAGVAAGASTRGGKRHASRRARRIRGVVVYRLRRSARVRIAIDQRRRGHGLVRRVVRVRPSHAGRTRIPLRRLTNSVKLRRGAYRVTLVSLDGNGTPRRAPFRVVR